jgi:hypothetical protein
MVLQGDDDGHEGRDGRRRGLPSEASGGRYATHCWALTRPLGRLGRHRLVSGGAIAQQWLVQELREHLVGHHLLRRAREPRPLRLPLLLLLLLLLLPLPLLLLLRGPVATGANGMRRRALRRRRATATRTGGLRRVDGAARAGDYGHYVECTGRTTRVQAVVFAAATSSGHSRGAGPTETQEGWGREAPFLVQNRRAGTWLAGLRRSDAASKCQNCPPIIFGTCNYADFRGNFSSRGNFITGQCIGTLLFQRRSSHYHSIDDYTVKQRLRTSVSIRGHAAGVTDRGEDVRAPFGYRSEGER